jgi:uncharacterized membrane protein
VTERRIGGLSAALALVGIAITGYLLYVRGTGATLACATGGCETVQTSRYAEIFGVAGDLLATGIAALALLRLKVAVPSYLSAAGPPGIADDARADGSKLVAWPRVRERDRLLNGASGPARDARR